MTGGVDTHLDVHVAAAFDRVGGLLGTKPFEVSPAGYKALFGWLEGFGRVRKVGVEGTGSYGAELARFLCRQGVEVIEVDRPNRAERRRSGKSDPLDAIAAAELHSVVEQEHLEVKGRHGRGDPGPRRRQTLGSPGAGEGAYPGAPPRDHCS